MISALFMDLRFAIRQLLRRPAWAATIILTLAIGIGANTAIFSLIDALLFRAPAGVTAKGLMVVMLRDQAGRLIGLSYPDFDIASHRVTGDLAITAFKSTDVSIASQPARVTHAEVVSYNYFSVLGVPLTSGRSFLKSDAAPDSVPVAIISERLWRDSFGARPNLGGETVVINRVPVPVVGVVGRPFRGMQASQYADVWLPLTIETTALLGLPEPADPNTHWLRAIAKVPATSSRPSGIIDSLGAGMPSVELAGDQHLNVTAMAMNGAVDPGRRDEVSSVLGLVAALPLLLLVVACANVSNVLTASNRSRSSEFAVRRSLGASRGHLAKQLLAESLLIAVIAGVTGLLLSYAIVYAVGRFSEVSNLDIAVSAPDPRTLMLTIAVTLLTTVGCGLVPALSASRRATQLQSRRTGRTLSGATSAAFLVLQVAVSLTMVLVAAMFVQSFIRALNVPKGFDAAGVVTGSVDLPNSGFSAEHQRQISQQIIDRVRAIPGVTAVGLTSSVPLAGYLASTTVESQGPDRKTVDVTVSWVSPGYFETVGTRLRQGRTFSPSDLPGSTPVAILNEAAARRLYGDHDAIGRLVRKSGSTEAWLSVVGVVENGKYGSLTEAARPAYFLPWYQDRVHRRLSVVAKAPSLHETELPLTLAIQASLPGHVPYDVTELSTLVHRAAMPQESAAGLIGLFGLLTISLAMTGVYGVSSQIASLRQGDVAIMMALGASTRHVLNRIGRRVVIAVGCGLLLGFSLTLLFAKLLASLLFDLSSAEGSLIAAAGFTVAAIAICATYLPIWMVTRQDPSLLLRKS